MVAAVTTATQSSCCSFGKSYVVFFDAKWWIVFLFLEESRATTLEIRYCPSCGTKLHEEPHPPNGPAN